MFLATERFHTAFHPIEWCHDNKNVQRVWKVVASFMALHPEWNRYIQYASHPLSAVTSLKRPRVAAYHAAVTVTMYAQPKLTQQVLQGVATVQPVYNIFYQDNPDIPKELFQLASTVTLIAASHYFQLEMRALTIAFQILCELYEASSRLFGSEEKDWISYLEIFSNIALASLRFQLGKNDLLDAYNRHFGKELTQEDLNVYIEQQAEEKIEPETTAEDVIRHTLSGIIKAFKNTYADSYEVDEGLEDLLVEHFAAGVKSGNYNEPALEKLLQENVRFVGVSEDVSPEVAQLKTMWTAVYYLIACLQVYRLDEFDVVPKEFANAFLKLVGMSIVNGENPGLDILNISQLILQKIPYRRNYFDKYDYDDYDDYDDDLKLPSSPQTKSEEEIRFIEKISKLLCLQSIRRFEAIISKVKEAFIGQIQRLPSFFMTAEQLEEERRGPDFAQYLRDHGFSNRIQNLMIDWYEKEEVFRNMIFESCFFSGRFNFSVIRNSAFLNCDFDGASIESSKLSAVFFDRCNFKEFMISKTDLQDVLFSHSSFESTGICESVLKRVVFAFNNMKTCQFNGSYFKNVLLHHVDIVEGNFLHASVEKLVARCTTFTDTVFGNLKNKITFLDCQFKKLKPIIAYPTSTRSMVEWGSGPKECLRDCEAAVMPFEYHPYQIFGEDGYSSKISREIYSEVEEILAAHQNEIETTPFASRIGIVFDNVEEGTHLAKIKEWVGTAMWEADGVAVHGGANVHEIFYSSDPDDDNKDILQDLVEGFAIYIAGQKKKPTLGLCRGLQFINVVFGGTLRDVDEKKQGDHWIDMYVPVSKRAQELFSGFRKISHIFMNSMHSQQCDKIPPALEVVIEQKGVPKIVVGENVQGHQYHPEWYLESDSNTETTHPAMKGQLIANKSCYERFVDLVKRRTCNLRPLPQQ